MAPDTYTDWPPLVFQDEFRGRAPGTVLTLIGCQDSHTRTLWGASDYRCIAGVQARLLL
jgi:hypothetical protein